MRSGNRVGISIGVLNNGKSFIYNYGSTTPGQQRLPTGNSVYELASITKTFSSALLAQAVIDKKAKLDDDIRLYLDEEYPNLEYKGTPIKLVNLANLTSGLPNWMPDNKDLFNNANPDSIPYILDALHKKYTRTDLYRDLHWVNLDIVPGSVTKHCNTAAQLLGYIMEKVYGAPLEMVLRKQLTGPLNMNNTTFLTEGNLPAALVKGYDGKGKLMPFIVWDDLKVAASLSSTVADMLKYVAYEMDEHKAEVNLSHQPTNGKPEMGAIALNWKINQTATNGLKISHTGGSLGFSTYMVFYPHAKMGIVLLTNEADPATQGELISLADKVLGSK
ncbi:hypothetical protein GCM10011425_40240 [Mucilaginibacter galii]|uniref:Beta-lactamase-related domain-containing protein n=2 Tax=Mucilaginibacter galii TaxID=2005073 RepID=A0A917JDZ5_9SPHI|nr:hypothetical protein GCM10011425_40240 [Mucilaginibacter galii]